MLPPFFYLKKPKNVAIPRKTTEKVERNPTILRSTRRKGLIFAVRNGKIHLRDEHNNNKLVGKHFYFGKNAGLFTLATWFVVNVCLAATEAQHFSVRGFGCALFYLGASNVKEPFTFYRNIDGAGRIVIPRDLRQALGLQAGDAVSIRITEEGILLCPLKEK